jgi:hypothetical protein
VALNAEPLAGFRAVFLFTFPAGMENGILHGERMHGTLPLVIMNRVTGPAGFGFLEITQLNGFLRLRYFYINISGFIIPARIEKQYYHNSN